MDNLFFFTLSVLFIKWVCLEKVVAAHVEEKRGKG